MILTIICVIASLALVVSVVTMVLVLNKKTSSKMEEQDKNDIVSKINVGLDFLTKGLTESQKANNGATIEIVKNLQEGLTANNEALEKRVMQLIKQLDERMQAISKMQEEKLAVIDKELKVLEKQANDIRKSNMREFESILTRQQKRTLKEMKKEGRRKYHSAHPANMQRMIPNPGFMPKPSVQTK